MARSDRKKLPPALDAREVDLINSTVEQSGAAPAKQDGPAVTVPPQVQDQPPEKPQPQRLNGSDLRFYIAGKSELADALNDAINKFDPTMRKFVKPSGLMKEFMAQNDTALAGLFRKTKI